MVELALRDPFRRAPALNPGLVKRFCLLGDVVSFQFDNDFLHRTTLSFLSISIDEIFRQPLPEDWKVFLSLLVSLAPACSGDYGTISLHMTPLYLEKILVSINFGKDVYWAEDLESLYAESYLNSPGSKDLFLTDTTVFYSLQGTIRDPYDWETPNLLEVFLFDRPLYLFMKTTNSDKRGVVLSLLNKLENLVDPLLFRTGQKYLASVSASSVYSVDGHYYVAGDVFDNDKLGRVDQVLIYERDILFYNFDSSQGSWGDKRDQRFDIDHITKKPIVKFIGEPIDIGSGVWVSKYLCGEDPRPVNYQSLEYDLTVTSYHFNYDVILSEEEKDGDLYDPVLLSKIIGISITQPSEKRVLQPGSILGQREGFAWKGSYWSASLVREFLLDVSDQSSWDDFRELYFKDSGVYWTYWCRLEWVLPEEYGSIYSGKGLHYYRGVLKPIVEYNVSRVLGRIDTLFDGTPIFIRDLIDQTPLSLNLANFRGDPIDLTYSSEFSELYGVDLSSVTVSDPMILFMRATDHFYVLGVVLGRDEPAFHSYFPTENDLVPHLFSWPMDFVVFYFDPLDPANLKLLLPGGIEKKFPRIISDTDFLRNLEAGFSYSDRDIFLEDLAYLKKCLSYWTVKESLKDRLIFCPTMVSPGNLLNFGSNLMALIGP